MSCLGDDFPNYGARTQICPRGRPKIKDIITKTTDTTDTTKITKITSSLAGKSRSSMFTEATKRAK
jgi:hypothetical protein